METLYRVLSDTSLTKPIDYQAGSLSENMYLLPTKYIYFTYNPQRMTNFHHVEIQLKTTEANFLNKHQVEMREEALDCKEDELDNTNCNL